MNLEGTIVASGLLEGVNGNHHVAAIDMCVGVFSLSEGVPREDVIRRKDGCVILRAPDHKLYP
jgi:hypothetical protein